MIATTHFSKSWTPEKQKEYSKKYSKQYYSEHREEIKANYSPEQRALRHIKNKTADNKRSSTYRKANRKHINDHRKKQIPHFRIKYLGKLICPICGKIGYAKVNYNRNINTGNVVYRRAYVQHSNGSVNGKTIWSYCYPSKASLIIQSDSDNKIKGENQ